MFNPQSKKLLLAVDVYEPVDITYTSSGSHSFTLNRAGNYQITICGGGGGTSYRTWAGGGAVAASVATGGSSGGFKGVITLPAGTYSVTVGSAGSDRKVQSGNYYDGGTAGSGGNSSLSSSSLGTIITAYKGTGGTAKSGSSGVGSGGSISVNTSVVTLVSYTTYSSGYSGTYKSKSGWAFPTGVSGGSSVLGNGYGKGSSTSSSASGGYFRITSIE